jgi:hypothetical protein
MSGIKRTIPTAQYLALLAANSPNGVNAVATLADVLASGGGNRIISGNASYSGTGLTYDVTALTYIIQGVLYASAATQVTLGAADPTNDRIDVIYVDDTGTVGVIAGTPAPTPAKPAVDNLTQVEVTFVTVPAGATAPPIVIEDIYDENLGTGGGEWNVSTTAPVIFNDTTDPYSGTVHIGTTAAFGPNRNIIFDDAPYTVNGGQLSFWMKAKTNMGITSGKILVGFFVGGSLVGNSVTVGGTPSSTFGFLGGTIGTWQLVTIPLVSFGGLPTTIDQLRFFTTGGANTAEFDLDLVEIQEGIPTPAPAAVTDEDVLVETDGVTSFNTQRDIRKLSGSTGVASGLIITDDAAGAVDITSGTVMIRTGGTETANLITASVLGVTGQALTDNSLNYIYVDYNAGTPTIAVTTNVATIIGNPFQNIVIGICYKEGTELHITNLQIPLPQINQKLAKRLTFVEGIVRQSGGVTTEVGTRQLAISAGNYWLALDEYSLSARDTSVSDTFSYFYQTLGVWTEVSAQTTIDNTQYNDTATGLAALANNQYGVHWVYEGLDEDLYVVYGTESYTLAAAENATIPAALPPQFNLFHNVLIAKIIVAKNGATFTDIQYPFEQAFQQGAVANHDDLGGLQGGTTDEHYHLTQAIYNTTVLNKLDATVAPASGDDSGDGYSEGSIWVDVTANKAYVCVDASLGAAIWTEITQAGGGGGGTAKFNHTTYAYDFVGASGTWNGNTIGAVGSTEYDDRWRVASFAGTGQADGFYINFRLSNEYIAGTNIRVEFDFATLVGGGGGNAHFGVGLCEPETLNNSFGSEATTTYITQDIAVQPGDRIATYSAVFSGTNLEPGDQISILVYRDPGNVGDTNNETLYVSTIQVEEV